MHYHYVASQANGKIIEGDFDAVNVAEVLTYLDSQNLKPISLKVEKGFEVESRWQKLLVRFTQSINLEDKIFLTKYLALMLRVGTDLFKAIDILIADFEKPAMKLLLSDIRSTLEKGQPFYSAFVKYPQYFSSVFINLIKAGESSGQLESILNKLNLSLAREQQIKTQIKSSIAYPIILMAGSIIVLFILVSFVVPRISVIFETANVEIPIFARVVFAVGGFLNHYFLLFLIILVGGIAGLFYFFTQNAIAQKMIVRHVYDIPLIGDVLKKISLQRFAATFASLLGASVPIIDALEITADTLGSVEYKVALQRIAREGIAKGLTIGDSFKREKIFPQMVINLIVISEKTGSMENILNTLADFYEAEIESSIKTLVTFLEPALLIFIGLIIGVVALSIIVPIYQLVGKF